MLSSILKTAFAFFATTSTNNTSQTELDNFSVPNLSLDTAVSSPPAAIPALTECPSVWNAQDGYPQLGSEFGTLKGEAGVSLTSKTGFVADEKVVSTVVSFSQEFRTTPSIKSTNQGFSYTSLGENTLSFRNKEIHSSLTCYPSTFTFRENSECLAERYTSIIPISLAQLLYKLRGVDLEPGSFHYYDEPDYPQSIECYVAPAVTEAVLALGDVANTQI